MKIETNGTYIHVKQWGAGEISLVFLHYYGGSSRTWSKVANKLSNQYHIVAPDHRGWGESGAPADGYRIADLADDAESIIETLGLQRYVIIGHSMGGKVAQLIASRQPSGLAGLVLVAPSPPSPTLISDEQRTTLAGAYLSHESVEFVIDHVLTAKPLDTDCRKQVIEDSLKGAPQAKAAWPNVAMMEDITGMVSSITVPTLVISGELDQVDPVATLQAELLPRIPQAVMHILPGTGHLSPLEAPTEVAQAIAQFVTAITNTATACSTPDQLTAAFNTALNSGNADTPF